MFSKGRSRARARSTCRPWRFASNFRCMAYSPSPSMRRALTSASVLSSERMSMPPRNDTAQPDRRARHEAYVLEIEAPHLDVRNGGVPPAPRGVRRALHVHVRHFEAVDGDAPLEERERRPGECNGIGGEPHPLLVGELEMTKREPRREAAPQARELDHASRQLRGDALDHRPAGSVLPAISTRAVNSAIDPPPNPTPTPRT